jgi:hypothetical protein
VPRGRNSTNERLEVLHPRLDGTGPRIAITPASEGGRLSTGMLVEASILARLLRLRILTLDARVLLLPAGASPSAPPIATSRDRRRWEEPRRQPTPRDGPKGTLGDAIRSLDKGAKLLAEVRRNRSLLDGEGHD